MLVEDDEYQLPIFVSDKPSDIARHLGISPKDMRARFAHAKNNKKFSKYVTVDIDEDDEQ